MPMSSLNSWTFIIIISLLSQVLSRKGRSIKASRQALKYFNPGNQAALRRMLSHWARVQRSAATRRCEQHEIFA